MRVCARPLKFKNALILGLYPTQKLYIAYVLRLESVLTLTRWIIIIFQKINSFKILNILSFHDLVWYCYIRSEVIQMVAFHNCDGFSHTSASYSDENSFNYFMDYLMTRMTLK
jgi:hypothetical protein